MASEDEKYYEVGPSLGLPVVNSAMYHDRLNGVFSLGVAFERPEPGSQRWGQHVVTSENKVFGVDCKEGVLIDFSSGGDVAVRRCTPLRLAGLFDEPRLSLEGLNRILDGSPSPSDLAPRIERKLRQYVCLPEDWHYKFLTVWVTLTYLYELFPVFPFVLLMSKHPGCGKSTLLSVLERLDFNAHRSNGMSKACLERVTHLSPGVLHLDEAEDAGRDRTLQSNINEALNSKFDSDSRMSKLVKGEDGDWDLRQFRLFSPLVVAKLAQGGVSDTILDRSIVIRMKRLGGDFDQEHPRYDTDWAGLRDDLYLWALRNWKAVLETFISDQTVRVGINRKADIWRVVLSGAKVLLNEEDFQVLMNQARSPEPSLGEDDLPIEFEAIADGLTQLRKKGKTSEKVTDFKKAMGDKVAQHLRGSKAFLEALRHLEDSHHIKVKAHGPGRTAHIFFLDEPLLGQPSQLRA